MRFYCVYCNYIREGIKRTIWEKTDEHFIPQSIGGKWEIPVCKKCNSFAGTNCDGYLAKVSWIYKFYSQGVIETQGLAFLLDGSKIPVKFKYQQKISTKHRQLFYCKELTTGNDLSKNNIKALEFQFETLSSLAESYPAILKIAIGAMYYLIQKNRKWHQVKVPFQDLTLARLREVFLGRGNFNSGGKGISHGPKIESLSLDEIKILLKDRNNASKRRHIISLEESGLGMKITMCLFSEFFWKVTIPCTYFLIGKLEEEFVLHQLSEVDLSIAGKLMHNNRSVSIHIAI